MATFNTTSTYNRTYEKKVIEEAPRVRLTSPLRVASPFSHTTIIQPPSFPSLFSTVSPSTGISSSTVHSTSSRSVGTSAGTLQQADDSLQAALNLSEFKPEELKVSVIGQWIVVDCQHAERTDDLGLVERHIVRKFALPKGCPPESVSSSLSSDGVLSISAVAPRTEGSPSRTIPIKIVGGATPQPTPAAATTEQQQ